MKEKYLSPAIKVIDIHIDNVILAGSPPPPGEHAGAKQFTLDFDDSSNANIDDEDI